LTGDLLNPHQRNSVAVTLRRLEEALRSAQAELSHQDEGILYRKASTLSAAQRRHLEALITSALGEIAALAESLELPVEVLDNRSAVWSKLALMWMDLYDVRAAQLRRYGQVAPGLESMLDPPLTRLIQTMEALTRALEK
jgi:hypothetical protein